MAFSDLVDYFAAHTVFPIQIDDIKEWCLLHTHQDVIEFHEVDIDPEVSLGQLYQFTTRPGVYADPRFHSYITVAKSGQKPALTHCEQRFVLCKELIHLTDKPSTRTSDMDQIDQLTRELSEAVPVSLGINQTASAIDRYTEFKTLAVLAPCDAVEAIRPKLERGEITTMDIAQYFKIPHYYVPYLMSSHYKKIYDTLLWS